MRRSVGAVLLVAMLGACGSDGGQSATAAPTTTRPDAPASVAAPEAAPVLPATHRNPDGTDVEVTDASRIVVLNGDIAEVVFALDLGASVVATDSSATYPPEAVALQSIGYQRSLSAEGILAQQPSVVIGTTDAGPPEVLSQVAAAGVPVVVLPADHTLAAPAAKIRAVAAALGVPGRGEALAAPMEDRLATIAAAAATVEEAPRVALLYLRGTNTQLLFGRDQGSDVIAAAVGAVPAVTVETTMPMTPEALVAAAPDVLIVTTTGLESVGGVDGLLQLAGIAETPAGAARRVLAYDDQMLLGFGPRFPDALDALLHDLHPELP